MKLLTRLIRAMSKEDLRNFRLFATRIRSSHYDKKLVDLFDALLEGRDEVELRLQEELYPEGNRNAFYRLKHRLQDEVQRSLIALHYDLDPQTRIMRFLSVARWCQYRGEYEAARQVLQKAEKVCEKERLPRWHRHVLEEQLALSRETVDLDPAPIVDALRHIDEQYRGTQALTQAHAMVSHQLRRTNISDPDQRLIDQLEQIQAQYSRLLEGAHPDQKWEFHQLVRDLFLEKKDYHGLQAYLLDSFEQFQAEGFFTKAYLREKIVLLSWIVNTLSQNHAFEESLLWTDKLRKALDEQGRRYYHQFVWTYYQALTVNYTSLGRLQEATDLLEQLRDSEEEDLPAAFAPYLYLNLVRLYHYLGNFSAAIQMLSHFLHRETFTELPKNLELGAAIAELVLRMESEDWEYAAYRYQELRRRYRAQLDQPEFDSDREFLQLLRTWIKRAELVPVPEVQAQGKVFLQKEQVPLNAGLFVSYKPWLYAQIHQVNHYDLVRQWMMQPPQAAELG